MTHLIQIAKQAKQSTPHLQRASKCEKNEALRLIADALLAEKSSILAANEQDILAAKAKGINEAIIDRIILNEERIESIAEAVLALSELTDPIGQVLNEWKRPNGLKISQVAVPIGVVGIIYEARPNVTVDAASLCLKTGNAVVLRGSSSAIHSNSALVNVIRRALKKSPLPENAVQLIEDTSREVAEKLFRLNDYLDVLIPRGSKNLIKTVVEKASVPVLETGAGNCHMYIDQTADVEMAISVSVNAKTQRPSVCNAIETLLINKKWFEQHGEKLLKALQKANVQIRGDRYVVKNDPSIELARDEDWETEFLDYVIAVKVVGDIDEAVNHINDFGTKHSEAIITQDQEAAVYFMNEVDAACVYHNASTRFTDGFEFGFGAEIGISTQKLHARGPMGLEALTSTKYLLVGDGQIK